MGADAGGDVMVRLGQPFPLGVELDVLRIGVARLVLAGLGERGPERLLVEALVHEPQDSEREIDDPGADLRGKVQHLDERARSRPDTDVILATDRDRGQLECGPVLLGGPDVLDSYIELQLGHCGGAPLYSANGLGLTVTGHGAAPARRALVRNGFGGMPLT